MLRLTRGRDRFNIDHMIDETRAYVLAHFNRQTLRAEVHEIRSFDRIPVLAEKITFGLLAKKYLERGFGGLAITPAGRAELKEWRAEHEGDWPRPPWKRSEFRTFLAAA